MEVSSQRITNPVVSNLIKMCWCDIYLFGLYLKMVVYEKVYSLKKMFFLHHAYIAQAVFNFMNFWFLMLFNFVYDSTIRLVWFEVHYSILSKQTKKCVASRIINLVSLISLDYTFEAPVKCTNWRFKNVFFLGSS